MRTRVQRWLSAPIFPDEEQTRIAGLLNLLLLALIVLALLDAVLLLVFAPETIPTFWMNGLTVLSGCLLLWVMRRGGVRLASAVLCLILWPLTVYYLAISGGLGSPSLGFLSLFVVIGVTLFGTRGAIGMGLLNVVFLAGLLMVGSRGLLVSIEAPPTLSRLFATNSVDLLLLTALVAVSGRSVHNALSRARNGERSLADRNRELQRESVERRRAEEALRESEERYRVISDMISDFAFCNRVAPDGTWVTEWETESFQRLTGYTAAEALDRQAKHNYWVFHPDDRARVDAEMLQLLQGKTVDNEYRIIRKSGEVRWLHLYRRPVWDNVQQRVVRYYGVAQDITDRKHVEQ
ncbi:MAG TPA: PAS domain-containing protein, partial [Aggregatilineaceae bacterium]|nr:PAS domain-containing protein [Aggregatilineaceae bacterium]